MGTKIRALGNIGEHNPKQNNIHIGVIQEATISAHNGKLIAFVCAGTTGSGNTLKYLFHVQPQKFISDAVLISKTTTFPQELISELLTLEQFAALGLNDTTTQANNPVLIDETAFANDITAFKKTGYQTVGFGEVLGGGVTKEEFEEMLNYDVNDDGVIGAINKLNAKLDSKKTSLGFLDGAKKTLGEWGVPEWGQTAIVWGGLAVGANLGAKAIFGNPLVGKKGLIIST